MTMSARLGKPKGYLGLSSDTNSLSRDRLDLADKNLTTVILRGKLGGTRYGIEAATYCGGPIPVRRSRRHSFRKIGVGELWGRRCASWVLEAKGVGWEARQMMMGLRRLAVYLDGIDVECISRGFRESGAHRIVTIPVGHCVGNLWFGVGRSRRCEGGRRAQKNKARERRVELGGQPGSEAPWSPHILPVSV